MMKKLLIILTLFAGILHANSMDDKVIEFEKKRLNNNNKRMEIQKVSIIHKQKVEIDGWFGYLIDLKVKLQDKVINAKDIVFTNGKLITVDLQNINTGKSIKDSIVPKLGKVFYNWDHLITGNSDAKNKIVIFSDPLCPACKNILPKMIKHVRKNKKSIALYYYHFPLIKLHPASNTLSKAMMAAKNKKIKKVEMKVYEEDFSKYFDVTQTDEIKILDAFNKALKTNITLEEIRTEKIHDQILIDIQMGDSVMVNSTPTIFINGKKDTTQQKYKTLGKQ